MEASAGLVAGSHNRNELVVIRRDGDPGVRARASIPACLARGASVTALIFFFLLLFLYVCVRAAEAAAGAERAGVPDLRRRRRPCPRRGALRGVQRVRLPRLPGLLRVRAPGGHAELPPVQDPIQAPQGWVSPTPSTEMQLHPGANEFTRGAAFDDSSLVSIAHSTRPMCGAGLCLQAASV